MKITIMKFISGLRLSLLLLVVGTVQADEFPVGHWSFDEPAGSTSVSDSSGYGNNGICGGNFAIQPGVTRTLNCPVFGIAGRVETAANFASASRQGIRVNNTIPNNFTVTAWFNTTSTGTGGAGSAAFSGRGIIWSDKGGGAPDTIAMSLTGNRLAFGTGENGGVGYNTLTSSMPINTGEWVCAAVTRDMSTGVKQLYINGQLDGSNTAGGTGTLTANPYIVFGANPLDNRYFDGKIDNIYFYDRVLSETEIQQHCPLPASADAGGPYIAAVNSDILLDGSGSTGGSTLSETWSSDGGTVSSGNTFTAGNVPGIYEVSLVVNDGPIDSEPSTTTVVVYDPTGGFVTGGGWIDSPAGAYTPDGVPYSEFGINLANGDLTGGTATPIQAAAYGDSSVYINNNGLCGSHWQLAGTLCDEAPTTNSLTISSKTNSNSGATYSNFAGNGTGVLVVDLGAVKSFDQVNVFQMFSDGKTSHFRISTHTESGAIAPDWQDAGWFAINGFDPIGTGTNLGGSPNQVSDPTVLPLPVSASRYVMIEVQNDGSHGNSNWIELRAFKLFRSSDDPLTGKANFGFNSKYKKGANVPTGQTEFQFKAGDFNFHSSDYQWLVVNQNGQNAQFKGTGTVNGEGNYGFMLWGSDGKQGGTADTFRIKIWNQEAGDGVVYDNGTDQTIGGGQIVIHTGK